MIVEQWQEQADEDDELFMFCENNIDKFSHVVYLFVRFNAIATRPSLADHTNFFHVAFHLKFRRFVYTLRLHCRWFVGFFSS